jgi:hypothetical protein
VFRHLVLARIIEPSGKLDSLRVRRRAVRTPGSAPRRWSSTTSAPFTSRPARGDGFREPGFSKERRLEPQITIGLLIGQDGFPLMVSAFEGNRAETKTMLPAIEKFTAARQLPDVTAVAGAGMISDANMKAIEAAELSFILGMKVPDVPCSIDEWRRQHPGEEIPDGHVFTQPWPAGPKDKRRDQVIYYTCKAGGHGGRCAAPTSRSPRRPRPSPGSPW